MDLRIHKLLNKLESEPIEPHRYDTLNNEYICNEEDCWLLKELGYDKPARYVYFQGVVYRQDACCNWNEGMDDEMCSIPKYVDAIKWLNIKLTKCA